MNSLLEADVVGGPEKEQQKDTEASFFMDEEAEEEPEDSKIPQHSPILKEHVRHSSSGSSTDSRNSDKEEDEEAAKERRVPKRKRELDGPLLPSIQSSIATSAGIPYSPPTEPESPMLSRGTSSATTSSVPQHQQHSQQQQQQAHHSVNTLPEKIANHPWIQCLTKNDYLGQSHSDSQAQHQLPQHPQNPHQAQHSLLSYGGFMGQQQQHSTGLSPPQYYGQSYIQPQHQQQQQARQLPHPQMQQPQHLQQQHAQQPQQPQQPHHGGYQIVSTTSRSAGAVQQQQQQQQQLQSAGGDGGQLSKESNFLDITEYLNMPQTQAAKHIGIPTSTLSKRWREAARQRKWPWRTVCKIDKEIMTLLHNVPTSSLSDENSIPEDVKQGISLLLRRRQAELQSVVIRIN